MVGFHGCIPEHNVTFEDKDTAISYFENTIEDLRDSGNELEQYSEEYYEVTKKTDILGDYVELSPCQENCLIEDLD